MATDDIEGRLSAVERGVAQLREQQGLIASDAAAARVLAAGADHDVSEVRAELRAHTSALNALRETQLEQGLRLDSIDGRLDSIDGRFDRLDGRFSIVDGRFDSVDGRLDSIDGRFDRLDGRFDIVDGRFDSVDGWLGSIDGQFDRLDGRVDGLGGRLGELETQLTDGFATVGAGMAQIVTLLEGLDDRGR